jgi:hypothetical protein
MGLVAHMDYTATGVYSTGEFLICPPAIVETVDPNDYAYLGTGSSNWYVFFHDISGSAVEIKAQPIQKESASIESIQKFIADTWGLSMERLADCCMTTRRSLYNWRSNINPRDYSAVRLFTLYRMAKDWREAGSPSPSSHIHEKLLGDKSLYELLLEDEIDVDAIAFIRSRLDMVSMKGITLTDPFKS